MTNFLDENFWLAISFCIFIYITYRPIKKAVLAALDTKINLIKQEVVEAKKLRQDAQLLLEQTSQKLKELNNLKEAMWGEGKKNIDAIIEEKNKDMDLFLDKKKKEAFNLINTQKLTAAEKLQSEFCDKVIALVADYFQSLDNSLLTAETINKLNAHTNIINSEDTHDKVLKAKSIK